MAAMAAGLNVRELLELERQLYQESIERARKQHEELLRGSLEDFVLRCIPFEDEKGWETEAAMVQLQLNKRNGLDLLEFELKQAEDTYKAQRQELKQQLLQTARRQLERLERRAVALDANTSTDSGVSAVLANSNSHRLEERCDTAPIESLSSREALARKLEQCMDSNERAFNLQHLVGVLPSGASVADAVVDELERLQRKQEQFAQTSPDDVNVHADASAQALSIDVPGDDSTTTFQVGDFVILMSQLSDEDFYGQIRSISDTAVHLVLVCGTPAHATLAALRSGRCSLTHQCAPDACMRFDERAIVNTKRIRFEAQRKKRGKRRRTVDIRRGF